jgi:hypothetical protein
MTCWIECAFFLCSSDDVHLYLKREADAKEFLYPYLFVR